MAHTGLDDLSALVVDIGSGTTKVGLAGGDVPSAVLPTVLGTLLSAGESAASAAASPAKAASRGGRLTFELQQPAAALSLRSPLGPDGLVEDWDGAEALLEHAVASRLPGVGGSSGGGGGNGAGAGSASSADAHLDLSAHPVILAEHLYASKADRERWAQILFEKHGAAGFFVAKAGVLALYANARTTGLVVDMGAGGTQVTPVQDGYALMMGARVHAIGGRVLDAQLAAAAEGGGAALHPRLALRKPAPAWAWHPSVTAWHRLELARDIKESLCRVSDEPLAQLAAAAAAAGAGAGAAGGVPMLAGQASYELPDGTLLTLREEVAAVPELIFQPSRPVERSAVPPPLAQALPDLLAASAMACDPEARRDLVGNLVLTGGASRLEGTYERLSKEFAPIAPVGTRARWAAAAPEERAYGVWTGGSILGSLGTFHDMWFSAAEYREHGAKMIHRKAP